VRAVSPRPRLDQSQQDALLDATVRVIARRGAERTRMLDVAKEVGRSTGTLQHYFGSRDELLAAAFLRVNDEAAAAARALAETEPEPWPRLQALLGSVLGPESGWHAEWALWLEFWAACARDPELRARTAGVYDVWRALLRQTVDDGVAAGAFSPSSPPDAIVTTLLAALDGIALHGLLGIGGVDRDAAHRLVTRLAADALGVAGAPRT
jgi:AcrR family transcriptional regulator